MSQRAHARAAANTTPTQPAKNPPASVAQPPAAPSLMQGLRDKLIVFRDGVISRADDSELENKKLIALYFSAHWCGPCRKFTPQLVEFYNRVAPQSSSSEITFASCDTLALQLGNLHARGSDAVAGSDRLRSGLTGSAGLSQPGGDGIPSLVLLDPQATCSPAATTAENISARKR